MIFVNLILSFIFAFLPKIAANSGHCKLLGAQKHAPLLSKKIFVSQSPYEYHGIITPIMGYSESEDNLFTSSLVYSLIILILTVLSIVGFWILIKKPLFRRAKSDDTSEHQLSIILN